MVCGSYYFVYYWSEFGDCFGLEVVIVGKFVGYYYGVDIFKVGVGML